jgi:hypothetical protein
VPRLRLLRLHVHFHLTRLGGVDAHVICLSLVARQSVLSFHEQYPRPIPLDELKVVGRDRRRARRFAGLRGFHRLRERDRFEHEIAH